MLISYLGDRLPQPRRARYRLLGCELTYHGDAPRRGETLAYDIHVDGHAQSGRRAPVLLPLRLHRERAARASACATVRRASSRRKSSTTPRASLEAPRQRARRRAGTARPRRAPVVPHALELRSAELEAFADGRRRRVLRPGLRAHPHPHRTPRIAAGACSSSTTVTELRSEAAGRGARLPARRARHPRPDDWFFDGHFKNDPCMPGTLMFEGCLQAMAFYLAAMGFTAPPRRLALRARARTSPTSCAAAAR
jgi:hypothetical protein